MRKTLLVLLDLCFMLLCDACINQGPTVVSVGTPHFVPQSQPDSVEEAGIGQDPATGGMFLQWYSTPGAVGYKLYRSDTTDENGNPTKFTMVSNISALCELTDTSAVDRSVTMGIKCYYYLRSCAYDGNLSSPSDTIEYELLPVPLLHYPRVDATIDLMDVYFFWHDATAGGYTVIRVKDVTVFPRATIWVSRRFRIFYAHPTRSFNFDSTATSVLEPGHSYQWRVDRFNADGNGRPYEGSRSQWRTFKLQ